ncbi:NAD-dependent epimerase/dehydratase family protein [Kitasatospora sp. NPDC056327]|uniref:NAD-dependent epimerase/dehydratase family protein n=1 Tax=Kitasatospora sp. NPDC056327 TaxID=3345785 RepID=UPI0035DB13BC
MTGTEARSPEGLPVVVLGGGFLGRHLGAAFAARGAEVHLLTRRGTAGPAGAVPAEPPEIAGFDLLAAAPREIAEVIRSVRAEVVVNAAGRAWQADEAEMTAGNAVLVERLVDALSLLPGPPVRLVQLGSVHEYGAGAPDGATTEEHEPEPVTAYGRSKLLGSHEVLYATEHRSVDGVVLRLANVIGAGVPAGSLFGQVAAHLARAARADARGDGAAELRLPPLRAARDVVDAVDAAAAVVAAATAPGARVTGRVINVGRGEAVPVRGLIDRLVELSGLDVPVVEDEAPGTARTDVARLLLDISRARDLLGWRPERSLDRSLRDLLAAVLPPTGAPPGTETDTPAYERVRP